MIVTKCFTWSMAHFLPKHDGLCQNIHGHNYKLEVSVEGCIPETTGMVVDFGLLKKVIKEELIDLYDHSFLIGPEIPSVLLDVLVLSSNVKLIRLDKPTTVENILNKFWDIVCGLLKDNFCNVSLNKLKLYETDNSWAELVNHD